MANILLIDDDPNLLAMTVELLQGAGHVVTSASNGNIGIRLVERQPFDLVITDLVMPEKEGIELIMELRRKHPALKIIAVSGGGRGSAKDYLRPAEKLGAWTLEKPYSGKALITAVNSALALSHS